MTDRQAKLTDIEFTWRMALRGPRFPVPHGTYDLEEVFVGIHANLHQVYEDNVARVFVEILRREMERTARRKKHLKVALACFGLALVLLAVWYF